MISIVRWTCLSVVLFSCLQANAFENLDFEQAVPLVDCANAPTGCTIQPIESILPHWSPIHTNADNGPVAYGLVYYNSGHIGTFPPIFSMFGGDPPTGSGFFSHMPGISGTYSLLIDSRGSGVELTQTGAVPAPARSIRFIGTYFGPEDGQGPSQPVLSASELDLFLNDAKLDVIELADLGTHRIFGANLPAFVAGTQAELKFSIPPLGEFQGRILTLDDISFSPIPIPEPSTTAILALGVSTWIGGSRSRR